MSKLRIAIVGIAHVHAIGFLNAFAPFPDEAEIIGFCDLPDPAGLPEESFEERLRKNFSPKGPRPPHLDSLDDLLALKPDLCCIATDIADHAAAATACLAHGASVIIEKPFALRLQDGLAIRDAARRSGANAFVNWPVAWFPAFNLAHELVQQGRIGKPLRFVYRSPATRGPYCNTPGFDPARLGQLWWYRHDRGGGSIADYAGYSFTLATWFLGRPPKTVYGLRKNFLLPFTDVEDYADFILDYGDAVAQAEGSWSTRSSGEIPTGPVIYGTDGTIVCDRFDPTVKVYTSFKPYTKALPPDETIQAPPQPAGSLGANLIAHLRHGQPIHHLLTLDFNLMALAALDAGVRSAASGQVENVLPLN